MTTTRRKLFKDRREAMVVFLSAMLVLIDKRDGVDELAYFAFMRREGHGFYQALLAAKHGVRFGLIERFADPEKAHAKRFRLREPVLTANT